MYIINQLVLNLMAELNGKEDLPETLSEIEVLLQRYCHENSLNNE